MIDLIVVHWLRSCSHLFFAHAHVLNIDQLKVEIDRFALLSFVCQLFSGIVLCKFALSNHTRERRRRRRRQSEKNYCYIKTKYNLCIFWSIYLSILSRVKATLSTCNYTISIILVQSILSTEKKKQKQKKPRIYCMWKGNNNWNLKGHSLSLVMCLCLG